jgi:hypothetical protein
MFVVHRDILFRRSPYFATQIAKIHVQEAKRNALKMRINCLQVPDMSSFEFEAWVAHLYNPGRNLVAWASTWFKDVHLHSVKPEWHGGWTMQDQYWVPSLIWMWTVATRFEDYTLANHIVDTIIARSPEFTKKTAQQLLVRPWMAFGLPPGAQFCCVAKWQIDFISSQLSADELGKFQEFANKRPQDEQELYFLCKIRERQIKNGQFVQPALPRWEDRCDYHHHEKGELCEAGKGWVRIEEVREGDVVTGWKVGGGLGWGDVGGWSEGWGYLGEGLG